MSLCAITTIDNPFNPLENFNDWLNFDMEKGYLTCEILDKNSYTSNQLSDKENNDEIEKAIDFLVENKFAINKLTGKIVPYKKVTK